MDYLALVIDNAAALGAASVLETLGLTSGEISQRQALKTYGSWFASALRDHRIRPARIEDGHAGTRWYRVVDILALKTRDAAKAEIYFKHNAQ